ncbi:snapalysin family zinc-dependent metalloprotease [Amycolatopsis cihanbeyliensis]|uniref:Extracellular small neutral protease n=1 Tax=Amycolatopsis cihanbeyliensis TaxID=1128664 RepID=A0A542DIJ9_AMYCI|nr:snapalysin family zinc-dependent metalloprotease [Amycolatopsis cihanbeyliensis]TQJ02903.1 snapalysin [Amycolatopsis cihanbeyliensis]
MSRKLFAALTLLFSLALAQLVGVPAATAAPAPETQQVRTLYYDSSRAAEFRDAMDEGARIWNESVSNVRLERGSPASITIIADNGWPRAQVRRLGSGTIWMGRQAVNQGHDEIRIAAHEFGHLLGLPDRRTGLCEDLMSGASAGTSCTNPYPNRAERAEVERNFGGWRPAESFRGFFPERELAVR